MKIPKFLLIHSSALDYSLKIVCKYKTITRETTNVGSGVTTHYRLILKQVDVTI